MPEINIRRVLPSDALALRDIRLAALKDAPYAFGSTFADESAEPDSYWDQVADRNASGFDSVRFLAEDGTNLCGLVGGVRWEDDPRTALLISMWVAPGQRRMGVGRLLIAAVFDWARDGGYRDVILGVTETNAPARKLYESLGCSLTDFTEPLRSNSALTLVQYRKPVGAG